MMKLKTIVLLIFVIYVSVFSQSIPEYVAGQAIIRFESNAYLGLSFQQNKGIIRANNTKVDSLFSVLQVYKVERLHPLEENTALGITTGMNRSFVIYFPKNIDMDSTLTLLGLNSVIEYAYKNRIMNTNVEPNDDEFGAQWGLTHINMESAWDIERGSSDIKIAILDAGFKLDHEDLSAKFSQIYKRDETDIDIDFYLSQGYTFISGEDYEVPDNDPTGKSPHGTHVAGIAAAQTNNTIGIASVGWNITLVPIRVGFYIIDPFGYKKSRIEADDWIRALDWIRNNNAADVVNMSFGRGGYPYQDEEDAINAAFNAGILLCGSSGNESLGWVGFPAAYSNVMAVGAIDETNTRPSWSNYGHYGLSLVAPGVDIISTFVDENGNDAYEYLDGTSMASPHVAAAGGFSTIF